MTYKTKKLGHDGEELAAQFLVSRGYRILARNLKTRYGEIDIVAQIDSTTVIVEVKTKQSTTFGLAAEMVDQRKQRKLRQLATTLANTKKLVDYRIDVIAIDWSKQPPIIEHIPAAC